MSARLSDAEVEELIELWRRNIAQDPVLSDAELTRLDGLAQRIKIRTWPPYVPPPGVPPPAVKIPKPSQQVMICSTGGGAPEA